VTFHIELTRPARRALSERLPESVAAACFAFIEGPLADNPYRVGKPLRDEWSGYWTARRGQFRILYSINDRLVVVTVIDIRHRRDAYRS